MSSHERKEQRQEHGGTREERRSQIEETEERGSAESTDLQQTLENCRRDLEAARDEARSHKDELLRALAESDNQRKRAAREVENAHKFALAQFLPELLPVKDSLELGLAAADDPAARPEALQEGMRLTLEKLSSVLNRFGIEEVAPEKEPFDPDRHEAIAVKEAYDVPPNKVLEVHQKGYLLNGRLVRPARVTVSRSPSP